MATTLTRPSAKTARWQATINYRTDAGICDVDHAIDELSELEELVERGPDWNTIISIKIVLTDPSDVDLTVEQANAR
jgi:hypothetical protein